MNRSILVLLAVLLSMSSPALWAAPFSVTFINPGRADEPFWRSVTRFMQPAARQLDIELEVLYAERDHMKMVALARQVTQRAHKPDYLLIVNEKMAGPEMLKLADAAHIKTLLAFSSFDSLQAAEMGTPRQRYPYWLGAITPNAADAGRLTAVELVRQARQTHAVGADGKVHLAMIAGDKSTPTGAQRLQGALDALEADPRVVLEQIVYAGWERNRAREQARALLLHFPTLNAIWCASDLMAYGAIDAAEAAGRKPGRDVLFSAFNNSPDVLRARIQGRISALAGGHFTAGAWALIMLYDYHHGIDFAGEALALQAPLFTLLDADLAQRFLNRYGDENYTSVDFRRLSRHLHPALPHYDFSLLSLLK